MTQSIAKTEYSEMSAGEEQAELTSKNTVKKHLSYTQSWWSTTFSPNRMKIICTGLVLVSIVAGSVAFFISSQPSWFKNTFVENDPTDTMVFDDLNKEKEVQEFTSLNNYDNTDDRVPQLRSYTGQERRRFPDSLGHMNIYIKKDNRQSYRRFRSPVARYDRRRMPLRGPFLNFMPWVPIFADRLTKQTIIYSQAGVYIIPPVINTYGQLFSVAQLIAAGYASLVSSGVSLYGNANMLRYFQPQPLIGPGIPLINPLTGGFSGGIRGNFGSFPNVRYHGARSNIDYSQEIEEEEEEGDDAYEREREDNNYRPGHNPYKNNIMPYKKNKYTKESARILAACRIVKKKISAASELFYPSDPGYNETIEHFISSSTAHSICSVQPGTAKDVATILKIVGEYRIPFAVKGGGHIYNPGFSSTTGIHISMTRFRKIDYHSDDNTVDMGAGLVWDDVYAALNPSNINVIGARSLGVGVAGYVLGGGYSWKTNQYGLAIDNICEFELVAPDGRIVDVNESSYPDIFFGLKGAHNNFGIVTNFKMRAVPQTLVYGGLLIYIPSEVQAILQATANFHVTNKDPKAQIIVYLSIVDGQLNIILAVFYDAPTPPNGMFDEFLAISHFGTLETGPFLSLIAAPAAAQKPVRGRVSTISIIDVTIRFLNSALNELLYRNSTLGSKLGVSFAIGITPFLSSYLDNSKPGAYPHVASSKPLFPVAIQMGWELASDDKTFLSELKSMTNAVLQLAVDDGQDVGGSKQIAYPNYASENTPLSQLYGKNLLKLQRIRKAWDPKNIMYLAGGFKL